MSRWVFGIRSGEMRTCRLTGRSAMLKVEEHQDGSKPNSDDKQAPERHPPPSLARGPSPSTGQVCPRADCERPGRERDENREIARIASRQGGGGQGSRTKAYIGGRRVQN